MKEKDNGMIDVEVSREAAEATERIRRHIESLPEEKRPKVCIKCITYNHGEFIRETLDGFLMQQTDFPFVAIVHDDASTDNTADIVREYAERYPDIIFPIFETENQYRKPGGPLTKIMQDAIDATGAPYVAMCEGDDYWTSPHKLQLQADFLDTHPDYVMVTHNHREYFQNTGSFGKPFDIPSQDYDLEKFVLWDYWLYQTLTVMYRASAFDINHFLLFRDRRDIVMFYNLLLQGKGHYFSDVMGVYRIHTGGVWCRLSFEKVFTTSYKVRRGIYDIEQSGIAAKYILWDIVSHGYSIRILFSHPKILLDSFSTYMKHFGLKKTSLIFFKRIIMGKHGFKDFESII